MPMISFSLSDFTVMTDVVLLRACSITLKLFPWFENEGLEYIYFTCVKPLVSFKTGTV